MLNSSIFRAYDIRGIYPDNLNEEAAYQIGLAFASYLKENDEGKKIVVGYDARISSPILERSFIEGVRDAGTNVLNIGFSTVDMIYFASSSMHLPAVMITASHNPKEWNGFKLMRKDAEMIGLDSGLSDIWKIIYEAKWSKEKERGEVEERDITQEFLSHILNVADTSDLKPMRVAIDASSGSVGPILQKVLKKLSIGYMSMNFTPDGRFPSHNPDPVISANVEELRNEVKNHHYHFGCAFDGDGDRIIFVDEKGETVSPSLAGALMAKYFLNKNAHGKIVYAATASQIVPDVINLYGGEAVREKVGHTFIKRRMKSEEGIFGIETSGHYYFKNNFYCDSGIAGFLIMLEILSRQKKNLSVLISELTKYVSIPEMNLKIGDPENLIKKIAQNFEGYEIDWLDGLTVKTPDFWLNLRPSMTEPLVRLNIEAKDELTLNRVKDDLMNLIEQFK